MTSRGSRSRPPRSECERRLFDRTASISPGTTQAAYAECRAHFDLDLCVLLREIPHRFSFLEIEHDPDALDLLGYDFDDQSVRRVTFVEHNMTMTSWPNQREGDFVLGDSRLSKRRDAARVQAALHHLGSRTATPPARSTTLSCCCTAPAARAGTGCCRRSRTSCSARGQPLDAARYYIVMPDGIGRGGSSKPSDGLRAKFPHYRYHDIIASQHRLLTEHLGIGHLRLVLGSSMGGMHCWMWGGMYPGFTDALVPIASQPVEISGRNWISRRIAIEAIRNDPDWSEGQLHDASPRTTSAPRRSPR